MSAVVRGYEPHHATDSAALYRASSDRVDVGVYPQGQSAEVAVALPRADFLAAVASECGVIVIDRADLPAVEAADEPDLVQIDGLTWNALDSPDSLRRHALAALALAEHLDAHPSVDEDEVERVLDVLNDCTSQADTYDLARSLVARGVRVGGEHQ